MAGELLWRPMTEADLAAVEVLAPVADDDDVHTGQWTAQRICGFIESGAGSCLLHVSSGPAGCYAVYVTR